MPEAPARREGLARRAVIDLQGGQSQTRQDQLAEEVPVALSYDDAPFAVMMASPCDLEDFALGFSLTELGLGAGDVLGIEVQPLLEGWRVNVRARQKVAPRQRTLPGRSGCGLCGSREIEDVLRSPPRVGEGSRVSGRAIERALDGLQTRQPLNAASGALHAAAWCTADGHILIVREDIGRHNALDKLVGAMQRQGLPFDTGFALVTSRASYEITIKAAAAGMTFVAAVSAPTALAVDLAQACGLTLVGFARPGRHVVYSHPQRLKGGG